MMDYVLDTDKNVAHKQGKSIVFTHCNEQIPNHWKPMVSKAHPKSFDHKPCPLCFPKWAREYIKDKEN